MKNLFYWFKYKRLVFKIPILGILCVIVYMYLNENFIENKVAHIYIDQATTPTLFQMVDAIKRPSKNPKLFIWHRFKQLPKDNSLLKQLNAHMVNAYSVCELCYPQKIEFAKNEIKEFYKKYKNYTFIFHINLSHALGYYEILSVFPKYKIKAIYMYEDSIGRSYWDKSTIKILQEFANMYPIVLKMTKIESMSLDADFLSYPIEEIDPHRLAENLSNEEKNKLATLIGLKTEDLLELRKQSHVVVFLDDPNLSKERTINVIENLIKKDALLKDKLWIYKNHPRVKGASESYKVIASKFRHLDLPSYIPAEIMILFGINLSLIGYGSSTFFSFNKNEILCYMKRTTKEYYLLLLKQIGKVDSCNLF